MPSSPITLRKCAVYVTRAEALRLDAYVMRVGKRKAPGILGVGEFTLEIALEEGRLMPRTYEKLFAALDREERAA